MVEPSLIGIDWGTSSFRAWAMDATGAVVEQIELASGILSVSDGNFEAVFEDNVGPWLDSNPSLPIIISGMITSRNGWCETPYLSLPVQSSDLASALTPFRTKRGRLINFVTGLAQNIDHGMPDVMRGEETELIGNIADSGVRDGLYVLPGTHSKWAIAEQGFITQFKTYMTGELFFVLSQYSILGRLRQEGEPSKRAFIEGVLAARRENGTILSTAFSARTLALFGRLEGNEISDYLSGLLIGSEVSSGLNVPVKPSAVMLIGRGDLVDRYRTAFNENNVEVVSSKSGMARRGLFEIANQAGLI